MTEHLPDTDTINAFNRAIVDEFRANGGKVGGQFEGANLLLLHTTGAKSGQPRVSPLAYFDIDGKLIVIGSFAGARSARPGCTICGPTRAPASRSERTRST